MKRKLPPHLSHGLIKAFLEDHPEAAGHVERRTVPGERAPRLLLDGDGLLAFGWWLTVASPLSLPEKMAVLSAMHDLSLAAKMPDVVP
jgi:hypothetical protein